jgi:polyferredoxin
VIRDELKQLDTSPKELRKFGLTVGAVFILLAAWCGWRHKPAAPYFLIPGLPLVLAGMARPKVLRPVYVAWMALAFGLGLIVSTILLTLFFYAIVTPIGWVARMAGKDFLSRRLDPKASSYWLHRDLSKPKAKVDFERQF